MTPGDHVDIDITLTGKYCSKRDGSDEILDVTNFPIPYSQEWAEISIKSLGRGICDAWRLKHRARYSRSSIHSS